MKIRESEVTRGEQGTGAAKRGVPPPQNSGQPSPYTEKSKHNSNVQICSYRLFLLKLSSTHEATDNQHPNGGEREDGRFDF
jgi:hypothetical protein